MIRVHLLFLKASTSARGSAEGNGMVNGQSPPHPRRNTCHLLRRSSGGTGGTRMSVLSQYLLAETVCNSQRSPGVTDSGGATKTIRLDLAIQVATADCQSAEVRVSRAAPSGESFVPGGLMAMTGPRRERCRASTSSKESYLPGLNRSTSERLPSVAVLSFRSSSPNHRKHSTGGRASRSIRRRASTE